MYESYWQLERKPFEPGTDAAFYYPGESHQAALIKLRYAIENRRSGALLAGGSGLGKTLLASTLRGVLGESFSPLKLLAFPQMPTDALLSYVAEAFAPADDAATFSIPQNLRRLENFLAANVAKERHAVLVIDEAHLIERADAWETLRLLMNFEPEGKPAWTILLSGQTSLLPRLQRMQSLEERLAVKCLLRPFTVEETASYVMHRLKVAGAIHDIFVPESFTTLHELTQGVPRRINRLCDLALLIGYAEEQSAVSPELLESVSQELVSVSPE